MTASCADAYGDVALEALKRQPLSARGGGVRRGVCPGRSALALSLGVETEDPQRLEAGLLFELAHNLNNGHSFLPRAQAGRGHRPACWACPAAELEACLDDLAGRGERGLRERVAGQDGVYLPSPVRCGDAHAAWRVREMS